MSTHKFKSLSQGAEFAVIFFKNVLFTLFTLGLYYPWAKVETLKYFYQTTDFKESRFVFHGTGNEIFKGFIKVYLLIIILYAFLIISTQSGDTTLSAIALLLFYAVLLLIMPLAIHGAVRYRASRTSWRGIHFKYLGDRKDMLKLFFKGFLLTIVTFGIYSSWFQVNIRKYVLEKLNFGNLSFKFNGTGGDLFFIHLKGVFLSYMTLGIYSFWYMKELHQYNIQNIELYQNDEKIKTNFKISAADVFELVVINMLLIIFTLGLASPWVTVRTIKFFINNIELEGNFDEETISQGKLDNYSDASGDDYLDFFDFDFI